MAVTPLEPSPVEPVESLRRALIQGFAGVGATRVAQTLLSFVVSALLARALGPQGFGSYTLVLSLVGLCALPAYAGLAMLTVRETARYDARPDSDGKWQDIAGLWHWSLGLSLAVACGMALLGLVVAAFGPGDVELTLNMGGDWWLWLVLVALVVVLVLMRMHTALLQGLRRVVVATLPDSVMRPVLFLVFLLVLFAGSALDTRSALLCYAAASAGALFYAHFLLRDVRGHFARSRLLRAKQGADQQAALKQKLEAGRWWAALLPLTGFAAVVYVNTELFVPLVGFLAGASEAAYFKVGMSFALLVALPLTLVEAVTKPQISRLYETGEGQRLRRLANRSGWVALGVSLPVLLALGLFGESLVSMAFGPEYLASVAPMNVLAIGFTVVNLVGPSMQLLYATSYEKDALVISGVSLICVVLLSIALIPEQGALGAAIAFAVVSVCRAVAFRFWASHRLRSHFPDLG